MATASVRCSLNPLWPEKRIHTKSFRYVETERIAARLEHLRAHWTKIVRKCEQKGPLRDYAREVINCERELTFRGVRFERMTDGEHLEAVPVSVVRTIRPARGKPRARR